MEKDNLLYCQMSDDLKNILISYMEPLGLKINMQNTEVFLEEVFNQKGLMPIFFLDKQSIIDEYLLNINQNKLEKLYAKIEVHTDNSALMEFVIIVNNNLISNKSTKNNKQYNKLLMVLAKAILSQKDLEVNDGVIGLDSLYSRMHNYYNNITKITALDVSTKNKTTI